MNRRDVLRSAAAAGASLATGGEAMAADGAGRGQAGPVVAVVTFHLRPGSEAEFLGLLTPLLDAMRHEPTFVNAVLHRDPEDASRFMLYETWADRVDLVEVQMKRDYRQAYEARLPALLREPRGVQVWHKLRADFAFFASGAG